MNKRRPLKANRMQCNTYINIFIYLHVIFVFRFFFFSGGGRNGYTAWYVLCSLIPPQAASLRHYYTQPDFSFSSEEHSINNRNLSQITVRKQTVRE